MSKMRQTEEIKAVKGEWVAFFQNNNFMGFVEPAGAKEIILGAISAGHDVREYRSYFNVRVSK